MRIAATHCILTLALAATAWTSAQAAVTSFTSLQEFTMAAGTVSVDALDDLTAGELPATLSRSTGGLAYQASSFSGLYAAGAAGAAFLSNSDRRDAIVLSQFSSGVRAVGATFFGSDEQGLALSNQTLEISWQDLQGGGGSTVLDINHAASFFGIVSDRALASLTISIAAGNLLAAWPSVDNIALAVPEPATYALMGLGVLAVAAASRRRRGASSVGEAA